MNIATKTTTKTFTQVAEVWVPDGDALVYAGGDYNGLSAFEDASRQTRFAKGEGLPGKAWAEARPVVLKQFDGSYFKRTDAARDAGLTSAVAAPRCLSNGRVIIHDGVKHAARPKGDLRESRAHATLANERCLLNTASIKQCDDPVSHGFYFVKAVTAGASMAW